MYRNFVPLLLAGRRQRAEFPPRLYTEILASEVDVTCVVLKSVCPCFVIRASGDILEAASFVIAVCRPPFAFKSRHRSVPNIEGVVAKRWDGR